jgi:16S rRNA (uracil1498-N3)-methyltransferase
MPRLFLPSVPEDGSPITLSGPEARYVLTVLRMRTGDGITLVDGSGAVCLAVIKGARAGSVSLEVTERLGAVREPPCGIVLLQGVLKGRKMDLVVQKATELGVKEIVPLMTERSQLRETRKLQRWRKIALEAARQSGRTVIPTVRSPIDIKEFFRTGEGSRRGFIFWEEGGEPLGTGGMPAPGEDLFSAVGPEGGFSREEVRLAEENGLKAATLGPLLLRAETAAIAAVTLLQFLGGRMGGNDPIT